MFLILKLSSVFGTEAILYSLIDHDGSLEWIPVCKTEEEWTEVHIIQDTMPQGHGISELYRIVAWCTTTSAVRLNCNVGHMSEWGEISHDFGRFSSDTGEHYGLLFADDGAAIDMGTHFKTAIGKMKAQANKKDGGVQIVLAVLKEAGQEQV